MISFKQLSEKSSTINWKTWIWIGLGLVTLPALRIYYVQELLAALIAFTLLFAALSAAILIIFLLVRASKPILAWAIPQAGGVMRRSVGTVEGVIAGPIWINAVPAWAKAVAHRFDRVVRTSVEAIENVIANPVWAKAAPVWAKARVLAKAVPDGFRRQLKLNENYRMVRSRFARLRPSHIYRASMQKGGAALTVGLRTHKRISNELGSWLTQRVSYSDLIRLRSISRARFIARGRRRTVRR